MSTTQAHASRRGAIGAIGLLAAGGLLPSATARADAEASATNLRLRRYIALHDRVDRECERFDAEVEMPARRAWRNMVDAYEAEPPPPHEQSITTFVNVFGDTIRLSTESVGAAVTARKVIHDPTWADMGDENWRQAHREIADAFDRREAVLAGQEARRRAFENNARSKFRIDAIINRSNSLAERRAALWQAAICVPVTNLADLLTKLEFIDRTTEQDEPREEVLVAIKADVRRVAEAA